MAGPADCGDPIAYLVLAEGTRVYASDGTEVGTVKHVLFVPEEDVFDGIVIDTDDGHRFVEAPDIDRIFERCVLTTLTREQVAALPRGEHGAPAYQADPALGAGHSLRDFYLRVFRKGGWVEETSGEKERKEEEKRGG
jgi:hypothetical protein